MSTVTFTALVKRVAKECQLSQRLARTILNSYHEIILDELGSSDRVILNKIGSLNLKLQPPRNFYVPTPDRAKKVITMPRRYRMSLRPSSKAQRALNHEKARA